jgi:hypothetical protein
MAQPLTATCRALPIVLDQSAHSERLLWIGCLALEFCHAEGPAHGDSLLLCLELTDRVRRRAAELRAARREHAIFACT